MSQLARLVCFSRDLNRNRTVAMVVVRLGASLRCSQLIREAGPKAVTALWLDALQTRP